MFDQIFGGDMPVALRFVLAFGIVLSLIVLTFVGLRRFAGRRLPLSNSGRARQPRLGVLDAFAIDARRRLVLIRRDNVEHLILIGGPNDVLVESEIVRSPSQAALAPQRAQRPGESTRAAVPPPHSQIGQRALPSPEPTPVAATPPAREQEAPPITPAAFRNAFPPRPAARPTIPATPQGAGQNTGSPPPRAPARQPRPDIEPAEATAHPAKPKAEIDPLYADIERKLGEALSRPTSAPPTPPAPTRTASPLPARSAAPPPSPARPSAPPPPRRTPERPLSERPMSERPLSERPMSERTMPERAAPERAPDRVLEPTSEPPASKAAKNHLDALEEEMASLLGRDRAT